MNKTSNQIADEVIETIRASCEASREDDSTEFFLSVRLICEELQARRAVETPSNQRVWEFDRYVDGRLKAEGVRISRAGTFEEACRAAVSLASPGSVLVLRRQDETSAQPAGDSWEDNAKYLLDRCPFTIRVREGNGPENLLSSLVVTFQGMERRLTGASENGEVGR